MLNLAEYRGKAASPPFSRKVAVWRKHSAASGG